ncbi:hypothetical protein OHB05_35130 [Streptomyces sp. NBC_00638]|uniref:CATRA system-associated protein n=1 Tax=unclassified Streptomyces TaxID=2593676 RepID=UPI00225B0EBA|nr:CATRA system-associated protein [Streptomyces sp. NBC_00638]MCX5007819.1 hypothetical protein [Streptomyces sp. NBC_00638]
MDVLDTVRLWRLTPSGWARVREALHELEAALREGDERRVRRATALVGLCGPARVGHSLSPGLDEPETAPPSTLEIINRIVRRIAPDEETVPPDDGR